MQTFRSSSKLFSSFIFVVGIFLSFFFPLLNPVVRKSWPPYLGKSIDSMCVFAQIRLVYAKKIEIVGHRRSVSHANIELDSVSLWLESLHFLKVTWIRIRDWHILTSGVLTYTADARFRVKHSETEASEWTLEIKFLQKRDEGTYYCQVRFPIFSIFKR